MNFFNTFQYVIGNLAENLAERIATNISENNQNSQSLNSNNPIHRNTYSQKKVDSNNIDKEIFLQDTDLNQLEFVFQMKQKLSLSNPYNFENTDDLNIGFSITSKILDSLISTSIIDNQSFEYNTDQNQIFKLLESFKYFEYQNQDITRFKIINDNFQIKLSNKEKRKLVEDQNNLNQNQNKLKNSYNCLEKEQNDLNNKQINNSKSYINLENQNKQMEQKLEKFKIDSIEIDKQNKIEINNLKIKLNDIKKQNDSNEEEIKSLKNKLNEANNNCEILNEEILKLKIHIKTINSKNKILSDYKEKYEILDEKQILLSDQSENYIIDNKNLIDKISLMNKTINEYEQKLINKDMQIDKQQKLINESYHDMMIETLKCAINGQLIAESLAIKKENLKLIFKLCKYTNDEIYALQEMSKSLTNELKDFILK